MAGVQSKNTPNSLPPQRVNDLQWEAFVPDALTLHHRTLAL